MEMGGYITGILPNTTVGGHDLQVYVGRIQGDSQLYGKFLCQFGTETLNMLKCTLF